MAGTKQPLNQFKEATSIGFPESSATQVLDGTSATAPSTVFSTTDETIIMITAAEDFHFDIGLGAIATTGDHRLLAGHYEFGVRPGDRIAVIKATTSTAGLVYVTPYRKTV
jgi:hypothetical protein